MTYPWYTDYYAAALMCFIITLLIALLVLLLMEIHSFVEFVS